MMRRRTIDKAARLQALKCTGRGRAIERDVGGERRLVRGSAPGQRRQQAILQRRDLEACSSLLEQRDMDLVQPPDQIAGPLLQRPQGVSFRRASYPRRAKQGR